MGTGLLVVRLDTFCAAAHPCHSLKSNYWRAELAILRSEGCAVQPLCFRITTRCDAVVRIRRATRIELCAGQRIVFRIGLGPQLHCPHKFDLVRIEHPPRNPLPPSTAICCSRGRSSRGEERGQRFAIGIPSAWHADCPNHLHSHRSMCPTIRQSTDPPVADPTPHRDGQTTPHAGTGQAGARLPHGVMNPLTARLRRPMRRSSRRTKDLSRWPAGHRPRPRMDKVYENQVRSGPRLSVVPPSKSPEKPDTPRRA